MQEVTENALVSSGVVDTGQVVDNRLDALRYWVDKYGRPAVQEAAGFINKRTIGIYLSQEKPMSWAAYHRIRRVLGDPVLTDETQ